MAIEKLHFVIQHYTEEEFRPHETRHWQMHHEKDYIFAQLFHEFVALPENVLWILDLLALKDFHIYVFTHTFIKFPQAIDIIVHVVEKEIFFSRKL